MKIENRTFIVSGGASGLGRACVEDLVRSSSTNVAVLDMSEEGSSAVAAELGPAVRPFVCDVLDSSSIAAAVGKAVDWARQTNRPLGGVVAAAGISLPATVLDRGGAAFSMDDFDLVLGVNLRGAVDLVRRAVEQLARVAADADGERGVVVLVASSAAFDGQKGQVSYAASKGAVAALTLPLARDLARYGIRCVTIAPSLFDTSMTSAMSDKVRRSLEATFEFPARAGRPAEFARLVRQAMENVMLNGTVIRLDGGSRPSKIYKI